ncbi:MAG: hypothetical protein ABI037_01095 [Gemmatimonadales bacterium]
MRYLLCTALALTACERRDVAHDTPVADSMATAAPAPAPAQTMSAVPDRLLGTWAAKGYDAGSSRAQRFTITWDRAPDGGLTGIVAFQPGESYKVKVVSTGESMIVYQSEPHPSPTLKSEVVTRTTARMIGDSLTGTYEARATKGGKVLQGRFTATRGSAPAK